MNGSVQQVVAAIAAGQMVIVVDSADRENEGDLVMAAQHVTARHVHFMATQGRGLICVPMTAERLSALQIEPMVAHNTDPAGTAFHISVDARTDTTTGISASDRAATIQALANPHASAHDFSRPGHVFPLAARAGGVLARPGHTEAAIDLCTLAGAQPAAVICEITDSDGEMARMPTLLDFAARHQIPMITIAELIAYRRGTETLIERVGKARLPLPHGPFSAVGYRDTTNDAEHIALVHGDVTTGHVPVHLHTECLPGDVFGSLLCNCNARLQRALDLIIANGAGVVIYRRDDRPQPHRLPSRPPHPHLDDIATQILADLGTNTYTTALQATTTTPPADPGDAPTPRTINLHQPRTQAASPRILAEPA
jgi:3,4-dihydroxy 2-butanone 4-phosphate synthase/GTP cyclohydrolase II